MGRPRLDSEVGALREPETQTQRDRETDRERGAEGLSGSLGELRPGKHPVMEEVPGWPRPHDSPSNPGLVLHSAPHGLVLHLSSLILVRHDSGFGATLPTRGQEPPKLLPLQQDLPLQLLRTEKQLVKTHPAGLAACAPALSQGDPTPAANLRGRQTGGGPVQRPVQQHGAQDGAQVSRHHTLLLQAAVVLQGQDDGVGGRLEAPGQVRRGGRRYCGPPHPPGARPP